MLVGAFHVTHDEGFLQAYQGLDFAVHSVVKPFYMELRTLHQRLSEQAGGSSVGNLFPVLLVTHKGFQLSLSLVSLCWSGMLGGIPIMLYGCI